SSIRLLSRSTANAKNVFSGNQKASFNCFCSFANSSAKTLLHSLFLSVAKDARAPEPPRLQVRSDKTHSQSATAGRLQSSHVPLQNSWEIRSHRTWSAKTRKPSRYVPSSTSQTRHHRCWSRNHLPRRCRA